MVHLFVSFSFSTRTAFFAGVASSLGEEVDLLSSIYAAADHHATCRKMEDCDATADYKLIAVKMRSVDFALAC